MRDPFGGARTGRTHVSDPRWEAEKVQHNQSATIANIHQLHGIQPIDAEYPLFLFCHNFGSALHPLEGYLQ